MAEAQAAHFAVATRACPTNIATIRRRIREELPAEAFRPRPLRALTALALVAAIAALTVVLVAIPLPAAAALLLSVVVGGLLFWVGLGLTIGVWPSLLAIVVPMLVANTSVMSYVATNHLLQPLVDDDDQLAASMSVTTHPWLDLIHFNFSHHVEHHLFPAMSSKYFPLVRAKLRRHAGDRYLAPPHWRALRMVFGTPRFHDPRDVLVDPASGRAMPIADVTEALRAEAA
jgi:fatty acid desaturase